jgi:hypothetical protein
MSNEWFYIRTDTDTDMNKQLKQIHLPGRSTYTSLALKNAIMRHNERQSTISHSGTKNYELARNNWPNH